jgi:ribosomal protein S27E
MTVITLICPHCGSRLTVSPAAPKVVTCPRCLYRLINPQGGQPQTVTAASLPAPPLPMKVLPLETQAHRDSGITVSMMIVLVVLLAVGAFISAATAGIESAMFNFILVLLLMGFTATVIVSSVRKQKRDREIAEAVTKMPQPSREQREMLMYQAPYQYSPTPTEPTSAAAAAGGFFASIALCAAGFFLLAATSGLSRPSSTAGMPATRGFFLLIVVAAVITYMIGIPAMARRPGWKGFGTGATIGLTLGMLALGPCAFCYLITLTA